MIQGPGENAGIIDIGDGDAVAFKIESHNHPSFIEPFQGAATGVGGILRDVFTMGARPIALMNALRFGSPKLAKTRHLVPQAVKGIGTYGNCVGVPTVGGELFFHSAYDGNCLVNAFALGVVQTDKIFLGHASGIGNPIFYVGSKTGKDGIHGATMASEEFNSDSEEKRPTVQVGDPFQEKLLLEACLEAMDSGVVVGIQDMGAAGLTSSLYEMAERAESGVRVHLDRVPQRETDMNPYEIMLSESQERMLIVGSREESEKLISIFEHWELDVVQIGEVVEGKDVELLWEGDVISTMSPLILSGAVPQYRWEEREPHHFSSRQEFSLDDVQLPENLGAVWLKLLQHENVCSRRPVYQQYDSTVRASTVVHPGGDAGVVRIKRKAPGSPDKGVAVTVDCNSVYCDINPRHGTALSVAESYRNLTCVGATPLALSDCLNFGSPEKPEGMWQIAESIRGLGEASSVFETPIVSGNVSLYNETSGKPILPTPMVSMVGLLDDASKAIPAFFQNDGDEIFVIGDLAGAQLGGSLYLSVLFGIEKGPLPHLDYDVEKRVSKVIRDLIDKRLLKSCHDVSAGGAAVAFAECCLHDYGGMGASIALEKSNERSDVQMFSESGPRYVVSFDPSKRKRIEEVLSRENISVCARGTVGGERIRFGELAELSFTETQIAWKSGLQGLFA